MNAAAKYDFTRVYVYHDAGPKNITYYVVDDMGNYTRVNDLPGTNFTYLDVYRKNGLSYGSFVALDSSSSWKDWFMFVGSAHAKPLTMAIEYLRDGAHMTSARNFNSTTNEYESVVFPSEAMRSHVFNGLVPAFVIPRYNGSGNGIYVNVYKSPELNTSRYLFTDAQSAEHRLDLELEHKEFSFKLTVRPPWQNVTDPPIFEFRNTDRPSVVVGVSVLPDGTIEAMAPQKTGSNNYRVMYLRAFNGTKNLVSVALDRQIGNARAKDNSLSVPAPWMLTNREQPRSPENIPTPDWEVWYDYAGGTRFWAASHPVIP